MIETLIFNVAITISGFYLFHRLQFFEEKEIVFSKNYITLLMTFISCLLLTNPLQFDDVTFVLAFVPLLFLARYTNFVYTMLGAVVTSLVAVFWLGYDMDIAIILLVIAAVTGLIGPFLSYSHFVSIQWLTAIGLAIIAASLYFRDLTHPMEYFILIFCSSFILSICSSLMFVDIWRISQLIQRYENEKTMDYLTGLGNVREFDRSLNKLSYEAEHRTIALLLIDIDGFKDVNDAYGHNAGDAVLRQMGQVLTNYIPRNIKAYRNGGEEFSVILTDVTLDAAIKLAESIRKGVKNSAFHLPNKETISLTVSIGVGYLQEKDIKSHRKIFKDADDTLHAAKEQGRDTVMFNPIIK
ncbi:GGDEF domain-containing protein GdpS [Macrococcus bovicus]|uniref:GGDEF domain-containing protein n=1 Tax=Macrococcus bovicus TaxID=69968 RepID=A0A4R6C0L0_9STAP|nr:GGDEF domain-containing protein [Macrococcus bovicus]TDM14681.1 GGDEF domain-containing protein [Macrococcus bovicus]WJP98306.1 GGDEF domain-containing protein [Macrococcus bovicus]